MSRHKTKTTKHKSKSKKCMGVENMREKLGVPVQIKKTKKYESRY